MQPVPLSMVRDWQQGLKAHGRTVQYLRAGASQARAIKARVVTGPGTEIAGAIDAYPIRVHVDARDFLSDQPPAKGDTITIDGTRCAVMQAGPVHVGENVVGWRLGVQS